MDSMYDLKDIPRKGKGLVATRKIPQGTRILCEEAIMQIPHSYDGLPNEELERRISAKFNALTDKNKQEFLNLRNVLPYKSPAEQYLGIIHTNGFPIEDGGGGIFLKASRINHACDNNASKSWNENIKRHTVHAIRDINQDEEITITYLAGHRSRQARQERLRTKFKFECSCRLCSLPAEESQKFDGILEGINRLDSLVRQLGLEGALSSPLSFLQHLDREAQLYNMTGTDDPGLFRLYLDAAQVFIAHGDLARGRIFAERAARGWQICLGSDNKQVLDHVALAQDPSQFSLYGMSMRWMTAVNEVPNELEPTEFEDWLWKREKPQRPGARVDLRNRSIFPAFGDLPTKGTLDVVSHQNTSEPSRHWCFLAEIVDFDFFLRLHMEISDVEGRKVPLFFYTDGRGMELEYAKIQKGYTLAILYAKKHAFMFDNPGIRQEDPTKLKIFPMSLQNLLELSDKIQQFSSDSGGHRSCHGCGKSSTSMKKCSKCSFFWYCDKTCQSRGWKEKNHKTSCKILQDHDLRNIFLLNWDQIDSHLSFPLPSNTDRGASST